MPISEAKKRADAKYRKDKTKQIQLQYRIEEYERIKKHCNALGIPMATWCKSVIIKAMEDKTQE